VPCCARCACPAGALFFYLREQLGEFAARLRSLRLEFCLTAQAAQVLAPRIQAQVRRNTC